MDNIRAIFASPTIGTDIRGNGVVHVDGRRYIPELLRSRHSEIFDMFPEEIRIWAGVKGMLSKASSLCADDVAIIIDGFGTQVDVQLSVETLGRIPKALFDLAKIGFREVKWSPAVVSTSGYAGWRKLVYTEYGHSCFAITGKVARTVVEDMSPESGDMMVPVDELLSPWRLKSKGFYDLYTTRDPT